jgi:hypothetical protein
MTPSPIAGALAVAARLGDPSLAASVRPVSMDPAFEGGSEPQGQRSVTSVVPESYAQGSVLGVTRTTTACS